MANFPNPGPDTAWGATALARYIGASGARQALHLVEKHGLPVFRVGRMIAFSRSAVDAWLARRQHGNAAS